MAKIKASLNGTKKEAITLKAAALFRDKGFTGSSMRELADIMGVEAPSLYNHIGSKSEILQIICFKIANAFNTHLATVERVGSSPAKLENLVRFHISMMVNAYDEVFVANHEWTQLEEPFLSNFLVQRKNYEARLVAIIAEGIAKKELKKINPYIAALTILSAVRGLESWHRHKNNVSLKELEKDMVQHLLKGLI